MKSYGHFINGSYVDPAGGQWLDTTNPFTGEPWARIARGTAEDVARAVAAAKSAMTTGAWSEFSASKRGAAMRRLADLIGEHRQQLAETEVRDNGKLLAEMQVQLNGLPNTGITMPVWRTRSRGTQSRSKRRTWSPSPRVSRSASSRRSRPGIRR